VVVAEARGVGEEIDGDLVGPGVAVFVEETQVAAVDGRGEGEVRVLANLE